MVFHGIAELPASLTAEEIPKSPIILRKKHQNLVQRAPGPAGFYLSEAGWV